MSSIKGSQIPDHSNQDGETFFGQEFSNASTGKAKKQRETVSWQFFFPSAIPESTVNNENLKQPGRSLQPVVRPLFFVPIAFIVGYVAFVSPFKILSQMPLLLPAWSGIQAMTQKPPELLKNPINSFTNTILWRIPFSVPVYLEWKDYAHGLQEAPWVSIWIEWWAAEGFNNVPSEGSMFHSPSIAAVVPESDMAQHFDSAFPKSYMLEGPVVLDTTELVDRLGVLEIHKPSVPRTKPALPTIPIVEELVKKPELASVVVPQKFMKRVDVSKEMDLKHFVKQAQRLADHQDLFGAIIAARQAYVLVPESLSIIGMLADLYLQSNQGALFTTFIDDLEPALKDSDTVKVLEARFALMNKDPEKALRIFNTVRTEPLGASQLSVLAAAHQMAGNHELSSQTYWKLLHLKPEDGRAWIGLSISLEAMQDKKNALVGYQKALGYHLESKVRDYAEGRVDRLKNSLK